MITRGTPVGRRTFLTQLTRTSLGLVTLTRGGAAIAVGGAGLATVATARADDDDDEVFTVHRAQNTFVSGYVLARDGKIAIVDAGFNAPGNFAAFEAAVQATGLGWRDVRHLILTHWHPDHIGNSAAILAAATRAKAYAGEHDVETIRANALFPAGARLRRLEDGDDVFDLEAVHAPGHTPGNLAIFHDESSMMLLGDTLTNVAGLAEPGAQFTPDPVAARRSIRRIARFDFENAYFGHGDPIIGGASAAIAAFAATMPNP
jgi:glyoxylase-like metal-dependent hydrolase (beta-lactamase superfamily II)